MASRIDVELKQTMSDEAKQLLLTGEKQQERIARQDELAREDIDRIYDRILAFRQDESMWFRLALTVGVALGAWYLTLKYHAAATVVAAATEVAVAAGACIWQSLVAVLSGMMAIGCGFMILDCICGRIRLDAFLLILADWRTARNYPRAYRGFDDAERRLQWCYSANRCSETPPCGSHRTGSEGEFVPSGFFRAPWPNARYIVMGAVLATQWVLSLYVLISELLGHGWGNLSYMLVGGLIVLVNAVLVGLFAWCLFHLRSGRWTTTARKRLWRDLIENCDAIR